MWEVGMRAIELFCGVGGMSTGLKKAGFQILRAYDKWPTAMNVYKANHRAEALREFSRSLGVLRGEAATTIRRNAGIIDLADILSVAYRTSDLIVDIICGGPPCQDFSTSGNRKERDKARLTVAFASVIAIRRPEWFLMENVEGALKTDTYKKARAIFRRSGYGLTEKVLDASYYGVPQARKRLIVIGRLSERDGFLESALNEAASPKRMTLRDAFGSDVGVPLRSPTDPGELRAVYLPRRRGKTVLSIDEPCYTVTSSARQPRPDNPGHPDDLAPANEMPVLTFQEIAKIQGFPDDYDWSQIKEGRSAGDLAVANSVPPPLAEAVGRVILDRHHGKSVPAIEPEFSDWLKDKQGLSGQVLRNRRSHLVRARKLLRGRTFADPTQEITQLESSTEFSALAAAPRSDLKKALKLYADWKDNYLPESEFFSKKLIQGKKELKVTFQTLNTSPKDQIRFKNMFHGLIDVRDRFAISKTLISIPGFKEKFPEKWSRVQHNLDPNKLPGLRGLWSSDMFEDESFPEGDHNRKVHPVDIWDDW